MLDALDVYLALPSENLRVGRAHFLLRKGSVSTTFRYAESYLQNPHAFSLEPALPLTGGTFHTDGLPGCFRDSLPDRWGRTLILRSKREAADHATTMRALDDVDYLTGVLDSTREGALRFCRPDSNPPMFLSSEGVIPPIVRLPELLEASSHVAADEGSFAEIKELLDAGSGSLGGARPKASAMDGEKLLLAKFPHPGDQWNVMAWEKTMLDLASAAGIAVPESRLVKLGNESVLLTERFDRERSEYAGGRIPYLSAMSLLGAADGETRDYAEVAEALSLLVDNPGAELATLLRRIAFSIAVHNTDDHLRNLGLLRIGGSWRLAPLFDVNPNPYANACRATSLMGDVSTGETERERLRELAELMGVPGTTVESIVTDVCKSVRQWERFARKNGVPTSERELFRQVFSL